MSDAINGRLNVKPLSVNQAWQGRRFKTKEYKSYERMLLHLLKPKECPKPPLAIYFKFGFSSSASDWDNPVKPLQDILAKKYKFNDNQIKLAVVEVVLVEKKKGIYRIQD